MTEHPENTPAFRTVRVAAPAEPVAALADAAAWQARAGYPEIRSAGGPVFGVAREREEGGWQLLPNLANATPQEARDAMGTHFRRRAEAAGAAGDPAARARWLAAAERTDWERVDELTVLDGRFRVVRADRFVRSGPEGPEPPRPTDPDPRVPGPPGAERDPAAGFVIDPVTPTGVSEGVLKLELLSAVFRTGTVPAPVRRDARQAVRSHPGGTLLPATFMASERIGGRWCPQDGGTSVTPRDARATLAMFLRVLVPWQLGLAPAARAEYDAAAGRLEDERLDEIRVAGRHFRVVRVERLVRIGPDGPEGPRSSDHDPQPPVMRQSSGGAAGVRPGGPDPDAAPAPLDEDARRFGELFREAEERRRRP